MNAPVQILSERIDLNVITESLREDNLLLEEMIRVAIHEQHPIAWRAAWVLNHVIEKNDRRLIPFIDLLIDRLIQDEKDGYQRELIKMISQLDLNDEQEGKLFDICLRIWQRIHKSPSVRIGAFRTLLKIVRKYPELMLEVDQWTGLEYLEPLSPGIRASINKLLKEHHLQSQ